MLNLPVGTCFQCRLQWQEDQPDPVHQWQACGVRPPQTSFRSNLCIHTTQGLQALDLPGNNCASTMVTCHVLFDQAWLCAYQGGPLNDVGLVCM